MTTCRLRRLSLTLVQSARTSLTYLWVHPSLDAKSIWSTYQKTKKLHVLCKNCTTVRDLRILPAEPVQSVVDHYRLTTLYKRMFERCSMVTIHPKVPGQTILSDHVLDRWWRSAQAKSRSAPHRPRRSDGSEYAAQLKRLAVFHHPHSILPLVEWVVLGCGMVF